MMQKSNLRHERALWRKGFRFVAGIDEVGVGPLAGPVVVGCVVCKKGFSFKNSDLVDVRDSKSLSAPKRERLARALRSNSHITYATSRVYPQTIDRKNIFQATRLAMRRVIKKINPRPDWLLIDGAAMLAGNSIPQRAIVKGDKKVFSIAAASILAKVARDNLMRSWAKKFPGYGFEIHKGYGTKAHYRALARLGPTKMHRASFLKR